MHPNSAPTGPESTRQALIEAGLHLFGAKGFAATSTREIAQAARANIASIAYHFGSKEGLRQAIADNVAATMRGVIDQAFGDPVVLPDGDPLARRQAAKAALGSAIDRMAQFLFASPMGAMIPRFVLREMTELSPSFDALYQGVFSLFTARPQEVRLRLFPPTPASVEANRSRPVRTTRPYGRAECGIRKCVFPVVRRGYLQY